MVNGHLAFMSRTGLEDGGVLIMCYSDLCFRKCSWLEQATGRGRRGVQFTVGKGL